LLLNNIKAVCSTEFTSVLMNLYRNGSDSNGWHSDDEKELGTDPVIASLSLGATRMFHLRHKFDKSQRHKMELTHGSLLLMSGKTQHFWQHQIPKTKKEVAPRINLTFRKIRVVKK
jgi:alkylated DNA repair dioxygenase AlkB